MSRQGGSGKGEGGQEVTSPPNEVNSLYIRNSFKQLSVSSLHTNPEKICDPLCPFGASRPPLAIAYSVCSYSSFKCCICEVTFCFRVHEIVLMILAKYNDHFVLLTTYQLLSWYHVWNTCSCIVTTIVRNDLFRYYVFVHLLHSLIKTVVDCTNADIRT